MTLPLVVLSVASLFAGLIDLPFHPHLVYLERWLNPVVGAILFTHHESLAAGLDLRGDRRAPSPLAAWSRLPRPLA